MTTFLALAQRLAQEAGISGAGSGTLPAAVTSQTGEMKRVVDWITAAYEDIQNIHEMWNFLRTEFSFSTIASTISYLPSAVSLTELATWREEGATVYLTSVADESHLSFLPWEDFRADTQFGTVPTGRPTTFSIKPDNAIALYPTPDVVYTVKGEYYKRPQTMSANGDEPLFPSRFHMAIVWRALMLYGAIEAAPDVYAHGQSEYNRLLRGLEQSQLPTIVTSGAMA